MSHTPLAPSPAPRDAAAPHGRAPGAVPPVPAPVVAEQPAPRVVWDDGGGGPHWVRLVALDWTDGAPPTYQVEVARGMSWWAPGDGVLWVPASELDRTQMFFALAAALDARQQAQRAAATRSAQ